MQELFTAAAALSPEGPLADRMRPRTLDDIIGQDHILGPGRLLRRAIQADRLSSVIFYGPPGTGKTSIARVIANTTKSVFESLNAVLTGIKDIREVIDRSDERRRLYGKRTILFVDEVHRWNKAQQDALLPWVENGTVILVGATTENPFFAVNRALVSRSRIFQLKPLSQADLQETVGRTLRDRERGYGKWQVSFEEGSLEHLVAVAGGDARSLLNALELAVETSGSPETGVSREQGPGGWPPQEGAVIRVSLEAAEESIQRRAVLYDRDGDYHFDTISAFIKSLRGSDPDAALYWLAKMVRAGEDPAFIFRRMIILASEDVGLADPQALGVVISCAEAFDRIGFPEGNFPLAHACLYLATAPKSNTVMAFFDALQAVDQEDGEVPNHLRDPSRDTEGFGHGAGYIYPHAYRDHWAAQQYLPTALQGKTFYRPSTLGYEGRIREETLRKQEIQAAVLMEKIEKMEKMEKEKMEKRETSGDAGATGEALSWSAASKGREGWFKRLDSGRSALLKADRDAILGLCSINRHDRILIPAGQDGLLLWESLRRTPEGLTAALVEGERDREALLRYAVSLEVVERPVIAVFPGGTLPSPEAGETLLGCACFDHILAREPWRRGAGPGVFRAFAEGARRLLVLGGDLVILQSPPVLGERISRILREECSGAEAVQALLEAAEETFFGFRDAEAERWTWDGAVLERAFQEAGFTTSLKVLEQKEARVLTERDLAVWFDTEQSPWGAFIAGVLGDEDFQVVRRALRERIRRGPVVWQWKSILLRSV
ncbi:MAG: AAA family ATPase [Treponema sp.]|jgi:putative ATPase|nr:AAA family ATPase [Treponema sp.]